MQARVHPRRRSLEIIQESERESNMKIALGLLCLLAWCLMCSGAIATESMLAGALIALLLRGHVWRHRG